MAERDRMADPIEVELKLELDPADHEAIAGASALAAVRPASERLVSTYFDTSDLTLHAHGMTLRLRRTGNGMVQTVKANGPEAGGLFARPEWERALDGETPVIDAATGPLDAILAGESVAERFASEVMRTTWIIASDGATIEVALDLGAVKAGDLSAAISELELELKDGSPEALFALARQLAKAAPLRLGVVTKSERGHALIEGRQQRAFKTERIRLDPDASASAAFSQIAQSCIRHFRLNETLLLQSGDVNALHQARVGLRRLRSAFSLFRQLFDGDSVADGLRSELCWLAGALGDVRNLDVLIGRTDGDIRHRLAKARVEALAVAMESLKSDRARTLMLDLAEWLAIGRWRMAPGDARRSAAPIEHVAAGLLDDHRRSLKKKGQHLSRLDDEHRHKVRIEAKKLRYAAEFFASLWKSKKARRRYRDFLAALEELQEVLGALSDLATAPHVFAQLGLEPPAFMGEDCDGLLDRAEAAHDLLMDAKRFWK
jgi:inorganic triphosphatase YgiF